MKKIPVDRSRTIDADRCRRLRWLSYHEGSGDDARGVQPVRKSIHLVIGGAIHVAQEILLRESQQWLSNNPSQDISRLFEVQTLPSGLLIRAIEDAAVAAALADLAKSTAHGIVLDENELPDAKAKPITTATASASTTLNDKLRMSLALEESPIIIEFGDVENGQFVNPPELPKNVVEFPKKPAETVVDFSAPIYAETTAVATVDEPINDDRLAQIEVANAQAATGMDDYLKEELAALVEAMVRAYSRRRLRPLLEQFEVLEVEREGQWKLSYFDSAPVGGYGEYDPDITELWFMSRLDALLLERSTGLLYLQSYKTTGSWDRRKESDAQVDMQGLTEAVDVDNRLAEAWHLLHDGPVWHNGTPGSGSSSLPPQVNEIVAPLVGQNMMGWLTSLPEPPRVLGVRYEYLLKGSRRSDKKDPVQPGRYVTDTPLIRAWMQEGITGSDRRWGHSYTVYNNLGKGKNLDYRSWRKVPVWRHMPIATWIDRLDAGLVQPEGLTEEGHPIDILAEQFIQPIHVYRNDDDLRDMLEQLEAKEVEIAEDVAAVKAVAHNQALKRSELNKRFPQNRSACSYPGKCAMWQICYGNAEMRANPLASELYQIREVNHPQELTYGKT